MKKLGLALFSCIALVAFMGMSGTALSAVDPSCDGDPYPNDPVIHDFTLATPDSGVEHRVSSFTGSGLACGSDTGTPLSIYDHATIKIAPGVDQASTSTMANGRFVGKAVVNIASVLAGGIAQDQEAVLTTEQISDTDDISFTDDCEDENPVGGDPPGTIITCIRGQGGLGYNHNWHTLGSDGKITLTIGPFHTFGVAGLTHIKQYSFCANAGQVGGSSFPADCGDSTQPYMQKNGDKSTTLPAPCANGNGVYTATATTRGGFTTPEATTCVPWTPATQTVNGTKSKVITP